MRYLILEGFVSSQFAFRTPQPLLHAPRSTLQTSHLPFFIPAPSPLTHAVCNFIRHFALHTLYLTLYLRHSKLQTRTPFSTVQIGDSRLRTLTLHCALHSALCTLHSALCALCTPHSALCTLRCPLPIGHFTLLNLNSTRFICFRFL